MNSPAGPRKRKAKPHRVRLVSEAFKALVARMGIEEMRCNVSYLKAQIAARPKIKRPRHRSVPTDRERQILLLWSRRGSLTPTEMERRAKALFPSERENPVARVSLERQAKKYIARAKKRGRLIMSGRPPRALSSEEMSRHEALALNEDEQGGTLGEGKTS